ncbi:hydrogenase maturation protease [Salmonella enterica]|nr:hydrogenase maturation protease [Salmonella enterica]
MAEVTILGLGNLLWADEGFGVRAAEKLFEQYADNERVDVVDGGTQGLALLQLTGCQLAEIVLIGVQPECLDDYGGSLTPRVKAQLMPAVSLAQEVLAQWGISASSASSSIERLNHGSLCMERYEDERPDAQSACRVGDIRVLQREKS